MMNFSASQISCGVHQLFGLGGDQPRLFHAAVKARVDILIASHKMDNKYISREKDLKPVTMAEFSKKPEWGGRALPAHFVFSDADKLENGYRFEKFLKDNNLGEVVRCESRLNVNSMNVITTWIWVVNKEAVFNWMNAHSFPDGTYMMGRDDLDREVKRLQDIIDQQKRTLESGTYGGCRCSACRGAWEEAVKKSEKELAAVQKRIAELDAAPSPAPTTPPPAEAAAVAA